MLSKEQADSLSESLLADGRQAQSQVATRVSQARAISVFARFLVSAATGFLVGGIFGHSQTGAFFPACVVGLVCGVGYAYLIGAMRQRREL